MDAAEQMDSGDAENSQLSVNDSLKYRGIAIIAIFSKFHSEGDNIKNTDEDRKYLEEAFKKLQYGVIVWDDIMNRKTFLTRLEKVSSDPIHKNCETLAVVIITHGNIDGDLQAYDETFKRQEVYDCFNADRCSALKNKLKIFIFHACRGVKHGRGVFLSGNSDEQKFQKKQFGDFIEKDSLVLYSTFKGNYAYGPKEKEASYFINALSTTMLNEANKTETERKHILALFTEVIRKTAIKEFGKKITKEGEEEIMIKQQPTLVFVLNQLYHFRNKEEIPANMLKEHVY